MQVQWSVSFISTINSYMYVVFVQASTINQPSPDVRMQDQEQDEEAWASHAPRTLSWTLNYILCILSFTIAHGCNHCTRLQIIAHGCKSLHTVFTPFLLVYPPLVSCACSAVSGPWNNRHTCLRGAEPRSYIYLRFAASYSVVTVVLFRVELVCISFL